MLRKRSLSLAAAFMIAITACLVARALPPASDSLVTRTYDLHDLINGALLSDPPSPDLYQPHEDSADLTPPPTPQQVEDEIIKKIHNTIEFNTWATVPPMKFEGDNLVVQQTPDV